MQICCPRISGKRRHSGDSGGKSQLKTPILRVILRHWTSYPLLTGKMISKLHTENACATKRMSFMPTESKKVDHLVKIYNSSTQIGKKTQSNKRLMQKEKQN
ncbi:hypothetical protein [Trabulsiella odontotermitis]|uniref:hypothetical protein n=1 Tax=Trabulsiella odontotermitis TaxID=379893 RepID=UPI00092FA775|nr:hypothetical protein [Trabulsiella odontotermitis]